MPGKIEPLGGVYAGIAGWGGAPEDDFVSVGPDCPQCGEDLPPIQTLLEVDISKANFRLCS